MLCFLRQGATRAAAYLAANLMESLMRVTELARRLLLPMALIAAPAFAQAQMPDKPTMPQAPGAPTVPTIGAPIPDVPPPAPPEAVPPPPVPEAAPVSPPEPAPAPPPPAPVAAQPPAAASVANADYPRCSASVKDQCIQTSTRTKRKKR